MDEISVIQYKHSLVEIKNIDIVTDKWKLV